MGDTVRVKVRYKIIDQGAVKYRSKIVLVESTSGENINILYGRAYDKLRSEVPKARVVSLGIVL